MTDTKTPRATRTPRTFDSVLQGALARPLKERVELRDALIKSIITEVELKAAEAKEAASLANGKV